MALTENVGVFAVKQALSYMDKDPEKNLPKLLDWFDRFDRKNTLKKQRDTIRKVVLDKDNNWHQLVMSLWTDIDPGVRNRMFENLIINGCLLGYQRQKANKEKYNCNIPWAILLDPTSACNLKCTGCWAAEYGNHMNLTYEEMNDIVNQGVEDATDSRRGNGTYQKIIHAMNILKERKLPFGISSCYTSANAEVIGSEEYFDQMIDMGAKFAWFFTYMPVGKGAVKELMATAEQREMMYHKIREYRQTKPIFTVDFWNDGEYVGGCIAGGRCYCHINANGDIEPCAFIHYSDSNIREKSLLEAYQSPLFMGYHDNQPWNDNMLRPCPVLDNPGRLTEIVEKNNAKSTDYQNLESAKEFSDKCVETAEKWAVVADRLWEDSRMSGSVIED